MCRSFSLVLLWAIVATAPGGEPLLRNPSFEQDADGDRVPDHWQYAGDSRLVAQDLSIAKGRDGRRCARLTCERFREGNPAAHVMLCQMGVPVERGGAYRVTLWARAEGLGDALVSIALSDTRGWHNCGLRDVFCPSAEWEEHTFAFRASRTCREKSRFQIWFHSTGTLWVDDVSFEPAGEDLFRPGHVLPAGEGNRVPNASFECGTGGWGSAEWDRTTHWGGRMNHLFGDCVSGETVHGTHSLRIALTPETLPVSSFDYFELHRAPVRAPLAANIGWMEVEPGKPHTLSAHLKADRPGTPARLAVREFQGGHFEKSARVGTEWSRYALTFQPRKRWCYILAGPDLRPAEGQPAPPQRATVWLDAVQLEPGESATPFAPRRRAEFTVSVRAGPELPDELLDREDLDEDLDLDKWSSPQVGNVFPWGHHLYVRLHCSLQGTHLKAPPGVDVRGMDFFDREVWHTTSAWPIRQTLSREPFDFSDTWDLNLRAAPYRGYYCVRARQKGDDPRLEQTLRLAFIPPFTARDSRFGVNHAYPWPHLLALCRKAGLLWVRDWSLKWHDIEPEKGRVDFSEADHQIDRALREGLNVLAMVPFPSSRWASTASPELKARRDYLGRREVAAMAPRDVAEFENFVFRTVRHYKGRIRWWQVFNEPVFTTYALPRQHGYTGADYARWTRAFVRAARRADPACRILAGIGYLREGQILGDWEQFLAAGGLQGIDAVDIHHYPRIRPPEFIEPLLGKLNALMDRHGGRKPIWCTEYGYYADDAPWAVPLPHSGFNRPLASEARQAAYAVRWATVLFANGVEKLFYHAGTCDGVNEDSLQGIFFEYGGQPHKIYAAQAVLAHLLPPSARFARSLELGRGIRGYLFEDDGRGVAVVWAPQGAESRPVRIGHEGVQWWDLMGRPQETREFTPDETPVYVVGPGLSVEAVERALR